MHVDQFVELRFRRLGKAGVPAGTRVVDEKVELLALPAAFEHLTHLLNEGIEALAVGHVERQRHRPADHGLDLRHHSLGLAAIGAVRDDDVGALFGQFQYGVPAQAAAAAGDECDGGCVASHGCLR